MYLKRLELAGFKSFADKTELEFVQGITAVVGPNGSGKSNISDAIRWVLGEQSARSLRGGKMEDIIFAGSDSRKAVNYGEVSLTLDNYDQALPLDFREVTISRRIHRSGESEYYINKQSCRLKDINELFMDTGIGKEAYSIIGQGRIEEILSTKSEDRRGIFEEASGIVKYKSRKREAQKKLEDTEHNLLRIHDLVSELEEQVEPLREQSQKAMEYKEFRDKLKINEIAVYVYQIEQIHQNWQDSSKQLADLQNSQLELSAVVGKHDAHLEQHRWETRRLEEDLERLQEQLLHLSEEYEKCEGQGEVLKERQKNLYNNREHASQTVEALQKRLADKEADRNGNQVRMAAIVADLEQLQTQLQLEEQRLIEVSGGLSGETEERLKSELLETLNHMAQSRNELKFIEQQAELLYRRMNKLDEENARWQEQRSELERKQHHLNNQLAAMARSITEVRDSYIQASERIKSLQTLSEDSQSMIRKWEQKLDAIISRRDTMREMQQDYEGFGQGVKEVLKARNRAAGLRGIHGAVAELVKVPAQVEIAVEIALGGSLQHIVVENEADGRLAIAFLKQRQLGRATFLPLDVIKARSIPDNDLRLLQGQAGFIGIASDMIKFEETYQPIVASLLGNVIIAETLEQANKLAAKCHYRYRIVTLEGDVVNTGGSMSGGSLSKKAASLLSRQRQIEELGDEIIESEETLEQLRSEEVQIKREISEQTSSMERLRQSGDQKRMEEQQLISEQGQIETEVKHIQLQLTLSEQDNSTNQSEFQSYEERKTSASAALELFQTEESRLIQAIKHAELERRETESAKDELLAQLTEVKIKAAAAAQEKQSLLEYLERIQAEVRGIRSELHAAEQQQGIIDRDMETNEQERTDQIELLNHNRLMKQQIVEQTDFKKAERAQWLRELETEENNTKDQRHQLKLLDDQLHQIELKVARLDIELDNLLKKLAEEYELSFELAKDRYPLEDDITVTQNLVKDLKRHIASLGEVNLGAIDEYLRVSERFEFLSTQKNDLMEAKAALYHVIKEMDEEMSKRFRISFDAIRSQFVIVFAKLFGGGRADLILSEPDQLLETGIEIVAQPPGKKLQNLQLLSGGERALTAIALLFAILRVKPVPFCVLDEVEAALDEANVTRFAEYLREFARETQFIVVTHRKGTMEEADVLYGVTMEEGGVSKLVSVRLEDEDAAVSA